MEWKNVNKVIERIEKKNKKKTTPGLEDCVASYFPIGNNAWVNNV